MHATTGKAGLLERIEQERAIWEGLLAAVGEERMTEPGATGSWTFKDVVAHLNGWRIRTLARLDAARSNREPPPPPWPAHLDDATPEGVDQINEWIYAANRDRPLREVLDESRQSFDRMREAVAALSEHDLTDPQRYPWMGGEPIGAVVVFSFGHFHEEHEPTLTAWLNRIGPRPGVPGGATEAREVAARQYEAAAAELERAAAHLRWTATHFRDGEVPRGCTHALAALGHLSKVRRQLDELAELQAAKSEI